MDTKQLTRCLDGLYHRLKHLEADHAQLRVKVLAQTHRLDEIAKLLPN